MFDVLLSHFHRVFEGKIETFSQFSKNRSTSHHALLSFKNSSPKIYGITEALVFRRKALAASSNLAHLGCHLLSDKASFF